MTGGENGQRRAGEPLNTSLFRIVNRSMKFQLFIVAALLIGAAVCTVEEKWVPDADKVAEVEAELDEKYFESKPIVVGRCCSGEYTKHIADVEVEGDDDKIEAFKNTDLKAEYEQKIADGELTEERREYEETIDKSTNIVERVEETSNDDEVNVGETDLAKVVAYKKEVCSNGKCEIYYFNADGVKIDFSTDRKRQGDIKTADGTDAPTDLTKSEVDNSGSGSDGEVTEKPDEETAVPSIGDLVTKDPNIDNSGSGSVDERDCTKTEAKQDDGTVVVTWKCVDGETKTYTYRPDGTNEVKTVDADGKEEIETKVEIDEVEGTKTTEHSDGEYTKVSTTKEVDGVLITTTHVYKVNDAGEKELVNTFVTKVERDGTIVKGETTTVDGKEVTTGVIIEKKYAEERDFEDRLADAIKDAFRTQTDRIVDGDEHYCVRADALSDTIKVCAAAVDGDITIKSDDLASWKEKINAEFGAAGIEAANIVPGAELTTASSASALVWSVAALLVVLLALF